MRDRLLVSAALASLVGCASAPEPAVPATPTRSLGLAFAPGACVKGTNVIGASAFVNAPNQPTSYLKPTDGTLRLELLLKGQVTPVTVRWREVPEPPNEPTLAPPASNLELSFVSPEPGECPIRVAFTPSAQASAKGLGPAVTTIVLKEAPPPPPLGAP